ncbi:MAG: helix-turn-helix domain-containing protein [Aggregatilineales bacterium]
MVISTSDVISATLTVEDVRRQALPLGTVILAGGERLDTTVRWTAVVAPGGRLPYLEGGELLLTLPGETDSDTLVHLIDAAREMNVAAVITPDQWPSPALATAQLCGLPVLRLPPGSRVREIEQSILALILDRAHSTERRGAQIYEQLVQLAAESSSLDRLVHELVRLIDKAVIVQDKRLHVEVAAVPPRMAADWDRLLGWLTQREELPAEFQDRHKLPMRTTPTILQALPDVPLSRLITPIVTQSIGRGYVSFIAPTDEFTEIDPLVNRHAAMVCALEMAHAKAISETEKRLRGDFLDSLMRGSVTEAEAITEGDRFGHDMNAPHVALVIGWQGAQHPSIRRLETLINGLASRRPQAILARLHESEVRVFYASDSASPVHAGRQLAVEIQAQAKREYTDAHLAIGIGSVAARVNEWRVSYREAGQAAELARRLKSESPLYIGDLGIYTFLAHPDYREDLLALRDSTIGSLIGYEEKQRADLLLTLEAFFQAHGNHTQTADLLNVHRNTLSYRMNRIAEITGLDLNQPDVRLAVHMALKIHRLLGTGE